MIDRQSFKSGRYLAHLWFSSSRIQMGPQKRITRCSVMEPCAAMGHVVVDRSNSQAAVASIQAVSKRLQNGMCIMFSLRVPRKAIYYPNGARFAWQQSPVTGIATVLVFGASSSTGSVWQPGPVRLMIHPPIQTTDRGGDVTTLMSQTEAAIRSGLTASAPETEVPISARG